MTAQLAGLSEWADGYAAGVRDALAGRGVLILEPELAGDEFAGGYAAGADSVSRPEAGAPVPVPIVCDELETVDATRRTAV